MLLHFLVFQLEGCVTFLVAPGHAGHGRHSLSSPSLSGFWQSDLLWPISEEGLQTKRGQSLTQDREGQPMSCHADDAVLKALG